MKRHEIVPRDRWQSTVESQGFLFHSIDDMPYWNEAACYSLTTEDVDALERATYALDKMCLDAIDHILSSDRLDAFGVSPRFHEWLYQSWETDEHTIYGRFDLAYAPGEPPKLLEYNADTPTALLEASVIQWHWLKDTGHGNDQFNSIHERLIEAWKNFSGGRESPVYFSALRDHVEDFMTVNYLRDTAIQAGLETEFIAIEEIAWNPQRRQFVDASERAIELIFKLYPWEWLFREEFGPNLLVSNTKWLEPAWKVLLSNKMILAVLWELFPESPYLLETSREPLPGNYVRKPVQGREGSNISVHEKGAVTYQSDGPYTGPYVYQQLHSPPKFGEWWAVIGSWMVNGYACGIGIREDDQPITSNTSRFVPHYIE